MKRDTIGSDAKRVPSLDGLRALSVGFVLFDHLTLAGALPWRQSWIDFGNLGVRIFFVISGFIITRLLLEERRSSGSISLKNFYIRRVFRIVPIWACYIGVILLVHYRRQSLPTATELVGVLTYNADYIHASSSDFQHLWSLSVEEKFYLLWPFTLSFAGQRKAARIALAALAIAPALRCFSSIHGASYADLLWPFHNTADAIATGCLLAFAWEWIGNHRNLAAKLSSPGGTLIALGAMLGVAACHKLGSVFWLVGPTLMNTLAASVIYGVVTNPNTVIGLLLNTSVMREIGRWSYGIYLWQQPLTLHRKLGLIAVFPFNVVALALISMVGYYLVEKKTQDYGRRITSRRRAVRVSG